MWYLDNRLVRWRTYVSCIPVMFVLDQHDQELAKMYLLLVKVVNAVRTLIDFNQSCAYEKITIHVPMYVLLYNCVCM